MSDKTKDDLLVKLYEKQEVISSDITEIKVVLGKQHESLVEHIRRTNILEDQMKPISVHVNRMEGAFKSIGFIVTVLGVVAGVAKAVSLFF